MTKYNLLQAIQDYSNLAYKQGDKIGSGAVTLKESVEKEGLARCMQFVKIANIIGELIPAESIEAINREVVHE